MKSALPMYDPPHPGEAICANLEELGWTVAECARKLGVARNTLSRLVNERIGVSPAIALGLERLGWSDADLWMSVQAAYDLAQERLRQEMVERKAKKSVRRESGRSNSRVADFQPGPAA